MNLEESNSAALLYPCGIRIFFCFLGLFIFFASRICFLHSVGVHSFFSLRSVFVKMLFHTYMLHPKMFESFSATLVRFDSLPLICILYGDAAGAAGGVYYPQYTVYTVLNDYTDRNNKPINK